MVLDSNNLTENLKTPMTGATTEAIVGEKEGGEWRTRREDSVRKKRNKFFNGVY